MKKTILYLPERSGSKPNACSYLRMIAPLSALARLEKIKIQELTDLSQLFKPEVIALTTNRTAFLDFPGLKNLIQENFLSKLLIHWDTDDFSKLSHQTALEREYLIKLSTAQDIIENTKSNLTCSTIFIKQNANSPEKFSVVRNSVPADNWQNKNLRVENSLLFYGHETYLEEIVRLSESFSEIGDRELKKMGISIEVVGSFQVKLHPVFTLTTIPGGSHYYPHFATWMAQRSKHIAGLSLIDESILNKGKSDLKFLEYSALGMATIAYKHRTFDENEGVYSRIGFIDRENPARSLCELLTDPNKLKQQGLDNQNWVINNRSLGRDTGDMLNYYRNLFHKLLT